MAKMQQKGAPVEEEDINTQSVEQKPKNDYQPKKEKVNEKKEEKAKANQEEKKDEKGKQQNAIKSAFAALAPPEEAKKSNPFQAMKDSLGASENHQSNVS